MSWLPIKKIPYYFEPTANKSKEIRKAKIKNYNLPFLQHLYNGDELSPLRCMMTGDLGWKKFPCLVSNKDKQRFNIDFNHIRQRQSINRASGISVDKGSYDPSSVFREFVFDDNLHYFTEFMCIMPVSQEIHKYISQDSQKGDLTLVNFPQKNWPWFLQSKTNFDQVCEKWGFKYKYDEFIDHLSDINHPGIHLRRFELDK